MGNASEDSDSARASTSVGPAPEGSRPRGSWGDGVGKPGLPSAPQPIDTPEGRGSPHAPWMCGTSGRTLLYRWPFSGPFATPLAPQISNPVTSCPLVPPGFLLSLPIPALGFLPLALFPPNMLHPSGSI